MKLYTQCKNCNSKIILPLEANSRGELRKLLGGSYVKIKCNHCSSEDHEYDVSEINAEISSKSLASGTIIGGIVGLMGGPLGMIIGGTVGALFGSANDTDNKRKVEIFNNSY